MSSIGDLGPGETYTASRRIGIDLGDHLRIRMNGGRITFEVDVDSRDGRQVFGDRVKVL